MPGLPQMIKYRAFTAARKIVVRHRAVV